MCEENTAVNQHSQIFTMQNSELNDLGITGSNVKNECPQFISELDALYTEDGCVDLDAVASIVKSHSGTQIPLIQPKSCSVRVCGQDGTDYSCKEDQLKAWKNHYLPLKMEMVVIGGIDQFQFDTSAMQLIILMCEDGKIFAIEDDVLHIVARNVKELHETGLIFPRFNFYKMGEHCQYWTEDEYYEMIESKKIKEMQEEHKKYRGMPTCNLYLECLEDF